MMNALVREQMMRDLETAPVPVPALGDNGNGQSGSGSPPSFVPNAGHVPNADLAAVVKPKERERERERGGERVSPLPEKLAEDKEWQREHLERERRAVALEMEQEAAQRAQDSAQRAPQPRSSNAGVLGVVTPIYVTRTTTYVARTLEYVSAHIASARSRTESTAGALLSGRYATIYYICCEHCYVHVYYRYVSSYN